MKKIIALLLIVLPFALEAGDIKAYEWESDRARYKLSDQEKLYTEYVLKNHIQYDYALEDDQFLMYATLHRIVYVNSSEAIEKNNRISIPMNSTFELVDIKARAINKDGKVVNFDKNNLKEIKDENEDHSYRLFAIEGVEIGSEVEFYYVRKMSSYLFERTFLQFDAPIKSASFLVSCPKHLVFDFKTYGNLPEVKKSVDGERNVFSTSMENVPALKKEDFSHYTTNRKRIEFKLAYNNAKSTARLYTWDQAAKRFYEVVTTISKDDEKALEKFYKTLNDRTGDPLPQRIRDIEEKIKLTVQVDKNASAPGVKEVASILKFKVANNEGMTRLMYSVFNYAKIPAHLVMTCDREVAKFDPDFDTWNYLDEYFLYFPDTKGFVAPYYFESRYPFIPYEFTAHQGLFIEPFTMGTVKSGLGTVQFIPAIDYKLNSDNMDLQVAFADDLTLNNITQVRDITGYNARYLAPYYTRMSKEDKKSLMDELIKQQSGPDAVIKSWSAEVIQKEQTQSFQMKTEFSSTHFLEKAGPKLLFKVGELIGPQTELYNENQRVTSIENDFNRLYDRVIKVTLPAGYSVKNPDDLNFKVVYEDKNGVPFGFISTYKLNGNELVITINEFYKEIFAPVERYEDFRKVINAAADFNKVTLVLARNN
jgi:hypothetical protein